MDERIALATAENLQRGAFQQCACKLRTNQRPHGAGADKVNSRIVQQLLLRLRHNDCVTVLCRPVLLELRDFSLEFIFETLEARCCDKLVAQPLG